DTAKPTVGPTVVTTQAGTVRPRQLSSPLGGSSLDESPISTLPGAPLGAEVQHTSTMQGTETTLDGPPEPPRAGLRRARTARLAAVIACALVALPVVILGGRKLGGFGAAASGDTLDASLDEAREHMRRSAWDAPPAHNFKDVTDAALTRWPG